MIKYKQAGMLLVFWLLGQLLFASVSVNDVRVSPANTKTRIVFELNQNTAYRLSQLSAPDRVVIDIDQAQFKADIGSLSLPQGGVLAIRHGVRDQKGLRIVIDLSSSQQVSSFLLKAEQQRPHRLVIDLTQQTIADRPPAVKHLKSGKRDTIIVIDPGHGGKDPGAIGKTSREKDIVLAISKELKKLIDAKAGYKAILTRSDDRFIFLANRPKIARKHNADLFVSVHADSFTRASARGASVFSLSLGGATSTMAKLLADKQNAADLIEGVDLSGKPDVLRQVLGELTMDATMEASADVQKQVIRSLAPRVKMHNENLNRAGFAVLKTANMPSILVETGFISNPTEEKNLGSKAYRKKLAQAIFSGIDKYFQMNPIPGTYIAFKKNNTAKVVSYKVKSGDTLSAIALKHRVSLAKVKAMNNLKDNRIKIGQLLKVPEV